MTGRDPTQKQIAEKYKGNLDYFRHGHYLRRFRTLAFTFAVLGTIAGVLGFRFWGTKEFFSTGPISQNHAQFANDCQACHEGAEGDLLKVLSIDRLKAKADAGDFGVQQVVQALPSMEKVKSSADKAVNDLSKVDRESLLALAAKGRGYASLSLMDKACLKCHQPMGLHQPQGPAIAIRAALKELPLVHAGACSSCHREHVGHQPMKLPGSESCQSCHDNKDELTRTRESLQLPGAHPPRQGEIRDLGDGLLRFLAVPDSLQTKPFKTYADGHPPFAYEAKGLRDPAHIKYNHARHELGDIPEVNGHKLNCADCHQPGGTGFYQRISYQKHCQTCHSLQFAPDMPELRIPHGDTEKVRDFLRPGSLTLHFAESLRVRGVSDRMEVGKQIKEQFDALANRGMTTAEELERRVFFVGDPPVEKEQERNTPKSNKAPFFPGCAKCHEVVPNGNNAPKVIPPQMADRWVHRGPFTHVPHAHMSCTDCHGAAKTSKLTSDILLPAQSTCVECHRPLDRTKLQDAQDTIKLRAEIQPDSHELADAQRRSGGIKWECQSCHVFHAPPAATLLIKADANK